MPSNIWTNFSSGTIRLCDWVGYILTNTSAAGNNITSLSSFDLTMGANSVIKTNLLPATPADQRFYNGFGYNTKDNYLYGYRYNTSQIVKVGADGNIELLTMTGNISSGSYAAGDVSPDGIPYLFGSNRFIDVDLDSNSPAYLVATQNCLTHLQLMILLLVLLTGKFTVLPVLQHASFFSLTLLRIQ